MRFHVLSWRVVRVTLQVGIQVHPLCILRAVAERLQASVVAMCQPWFYRRLEAYGFVGLSEGAYGGP